MRLWKPLSTASIVLAASLAAGSARGDAMLTPFGGVAFGGSADRSRGIFGASLTFAGDDALLGFEVDFASAPDFFGGSDDRFRKNNAMTLMGNLLLAPRLGGEGRTRVYVAAGFGLMRARVDNDEFLDADNNDFGVSIGGGLYGYLSNNVGLRLDVRFFRDLRDPEPDDEFDVAFGNFQFWRATGGLVLRF